MVQISSIHQSDFKHFTVDLNSVIYLISQLYQGTRGYGDGSNFKYSSIWFQVFYSGSKFCNLFDFTAISRLYNLCITYMIYSPIIFLDLHDW